MAYFFLDQLLYPSDDGCESQRGRKRCGGGGGGGGGPDWCDKKRAMRRGHWEAHFAAHGGHGGPHGGPHSHGPHHGHGPWGRHHHHHGGRHWGVPADRGLPIDFLERDSGFEILADIPGVEKTDIKLSVEGDVLSIKVENREAPAPDAGPDAGNAAADDGDFAMVSAEGQHGADGGGAANDGEGASGSADVKYLQHERSTDFPARAVRFPETADLSNVKASYINGVLKLEVPKLPAKEPQQIPIA